MGTIDLLVKSFTGLMLLLVGGLLPAAILVPKIQAPFSTVSLPSTFQLSALLLCSLVCGARPAVVAAVAYITMGLFFIPIFQGGGSIGYLLTPEFGYLAGFIPGAWISGKLTESVKNVNLINLTIYAIFGTLVIHFFGILNLIIGHITNRWEQGLMEQLFIYSIGVIPAQLGICCAIGTISKISRILLLK